jgi:putative intracellular protease/amidase
MATLKDTQDAQTKPLRIGVLIHAPVQLLDVSAIDLFGMLTRDYLAACKLPSPIVNLGVPVEIKYISSVPFTPPSEALSTKSLSATLISPASPPALAEMTASAALRLSTHIGDESVAPGMLDILFIPGPDPGLEIPEAVGVWLRGHREHGESDESVKNGKQGKSTGVTLMSVCTGIFILASSGVLDGYVATGPRALVGELSAQHPRVKWVDNVRWVRSGGKEGRIWTSGELVFLFLGCWSP